VRKKKEGGGILNICKILVYGFRVILTGIHRSGDFHFRRILNGRWFKMGPKEQLMWKK
jgi:hypothetical protein